MDLEQFEYVNYETLDFWLKHASFKNRVHEMDLQTVWVQKGDVRDRRVWWQCGGQRGSELQIVRFIIR